MPNYVDSRKKETHVCLFVFQLVFEVIRGGYDSDIAVDDIRFVDLYESPRKFGVNIIWDIYFSFLEVRPCAVLAQYSPGSKLFQQRAPYR